MGTGRGRSGHPQSLPNGILNPRLGERVQQEGLARGRRRHGHQGQPVAERAEAGGAAGVLGQGDVVDGGVVDADAVPRGGEPRHGSGLRAHTARKRRRSPMAGRRRMTSPRRSCWRRSGQDWRRHSLALLAPRRSMAIAIDVG